MRISILIACFSLPLFMKGQSIKLQNGKVLADDKIYALYELDGTRKNNIPIGSVDVDIKDDPEVTGTDFFNVSFSLPNSPEQYIFATAKVLASPKFAYLQYYYNIKFTTLYRELNITYHPYLIEYFAKDMVKYGVFNGGEWNEDAAIKLYNDWSKKISVIDEEKINTGKSINYNISALQIEPEENSMNISVKGNNIYLANKRVATYELSKKIKGIAIPGSAKGNYLYEITDTMGRGIALFRVPVLRSVVYLEPNGEKQAIEIITPERNEEKLITTAAKVLFLRQLIK